MLSAQKQLSARREILSRVPLFRTLTETELETIAQHATPQLYPRGSTILRQRDPASSMLIVLQGRIRIGVCLDDGREMNLRLVGPGGIIGEISLLDGQNCSADTHAIEPCTVLKVGRDFFLGMLRDSPDLCLRMMTVLCDKIRQTTTLVEEALLLDLPGRLDRQLQRMAREHGTITSDGVRIGARLSQSELASLIGASREKVNKQLKTWEREGYIQFRDGHIILRVSAGSHARS